jgi:proline iminopeptidase
MSRKLLAASVGTASFVLIITTTLLLAQGQPAQKAQVAGAALVPGRSPAAAQAGRGARPIVEEGFFNGADGIRLFYRKVGAGPETAVYLHGGPSSLADGGYELDALAAGRTLIALQQRSGGRSQLVNDPARLTTEHYVRDLEALQRHFGLTRVTLIGQSWGAMLAAMYTARHPESVDRLLLLSPGPPSSTYAERRTEKENLVIGPAGVARIAEISKAIESGPDDRVVGLCDEMMSIVFRVYLNDIASLRRMRVGYCNSPPAALRHELLASTVVYEKLGSYDFLPDLAKMRKPALVVEGAETKVPLDATRAWAAALPNGRMLLVPGAGHMTWLEGDVPALLRKLNQFLAGTWPEGAEIVRAPSRHP